MLDQLQSDTARTGVLDGQFFDLIVIGAGIAGLNALYSASQYLPKGARALLLDQKDAPGGMWNVAYDYVRLHQPHPMFTVGDMKWDWSHPRHYLAARDEVQSHLEKCLVPMAKHFNLTRGFGHTVTSCTEVVTSHGPRARVGFHPNGDLQSTATVMAAQVIEAEGFNVQQPDPLTLSSASLVSIGPASLRKTLAEHPGAAVYVIGGGKTAMDTIIEVVDRDPARSVSAVVGSGTDFFDRDENLPIGVERWKRGRPLSRIFQEQAMLFDGDNEDVVAAHFRANYATERNSSNKQFLYGVLSRAELAKVRSGLETCLIDYLEDISDTADGPLMSLRSGETLAVPEGSIIVNCTGMLFRSDNLLPPKPCLSTHGTILSVNTRDALHFLSSVGGFFLPHLHYRGLMKDQGFYTIDLDALFRKSRIAWVAATATQAYLTQALAVKTLPLMLLDRCGLDLDRWYPFPRRMAAVVKMKTGATREIPHCQKVLDRVAQRFDVHCGPLAASDRRN